MCMLAACWGTGLLGTMFVVAGFDATSGPAHFLLQLLGARRSR